MKKLYIYVACFLLVGSPTPLYANQTLDKEIISQAEQSEIISRVSQVQHRTID